MLTTRVVPTSGNAVVGGRVVDDMVHVYVRLGGPTLPEILMHADRGGREVRDAGVTAPMLETVFVSLAGKDLRE